MVYRLTGGGAERVAALWANGFVERGYQVSMIIVERTSSQYPMSDNVERLYITFPTKNRYIRKICKLVRLYQWYYLYKLNHILQSIQPDVFISVNGPYARDAEMMSRGLKTKIIQTCHSSFDLPNNAPAIRLEGLKNIYELEAHIKTHTVLTQADKDFIGDRFNRVYVMPNPLAFTPIKSIPVKEKIVMACGRLEVWDVKGFDLLIKAWGLVGRQYPDWRLQIVGADDGKSEKYLQGLARESHIEQQVDFLGFREDVVSLYKKAEIFVLSSRYEGFGMVLIEAMSQGCACIACDYKGRQKEIIEDETQGIICPADNLNALADSINKMISDAEYRNRCQLGALERVTYFSLDNTINRWEKIFREIGVPLNKTKN